MADDIVNELRHAAQTDNNPWDDTLYTRAADELERLAADNQRLRDALQIAANHMLTAGAPRIDIDTINQAARHAR